MGLVAVIPPVRSNVFTLAGALECCAKALPDSEASRNMLIGSNEAPFAGRVCPRSSEIRAAIDSK